MLHPSLHGYLVDQHQRELERTAKRARLLAEARRSAADTPSVTERMVLGTGRRLIDLGQRLCAHYPSEPQHALSRATPHQLRLSPLSTWTPSMLAGVADATTTVSPMSFVYYGFVSIGPRGITRAEYVTPLAQPVAGGRLEAGNRG